MILAHLHDPHSSWVHLTQFVYVQPVNTHRRNQSASVKPKTYRLKTHGEAKKSNIANNTSSQVTPIRLRTRMHQPAEAHSATATITTRWSLSPRLPCPSPPRQAPDRTSLLTGFNMPQMQFFDDRRCRRLTAFFDPFGFGIIVIDPSAGVHRVFG